MVRSGFGVPPAVTTSFGVGALERLLTLRLARRVWRPSSTIKMRRTWSLASSDAPHERPPPRS